MSDAAEHRLFKRHVKDPEKALVDLQRALRLHGFVRLRLYWAGSIAVFKGELGRVLQSVLRANPQRVRMDTLYARVTLAARAIGLKPGVEDIGADLEGGKVFGGVSFVPFTRLTAAFEKLRTKKRLVRSRTGK